MIARGWGLAANRNFVLTILVLTSNEEARMQDHAVVIAGGGPTGMMLAAELVLAGVDVVVVERRANQELESRRAGGLHARTLEVLDQRGIVDRFLAEGQIAQTHRVAGVTLSIDDFPTRHHHGLALWQRDFERILAGWVDELAVPIVRERDVVGFAQHDDSVDVALSDGTTLRAGYLVGCDGGRSVVRKTAGIDFVGTEATTGWLIAEVTMAEEPEVGVRREGGGIGPVNREQGGNPYGVVLREAGVEHPDAPTLQDVVDALHAAYGTDYGAHDPTFVSRFDDATRQATSYRDRRVLLAGDAAHVHPPQGGQGLNTGVQDAVNLGWKLAQVVDGTTPDTLLDTYHAERHPVGERALQHALAFVALQTGDDAHDALARVLAELLVMDEPRKHLAGDLSGLGIHYELGDGHPLVGRRMPDLDLQTADGPTRVFALLHDARPLLLDLGAEGDQRAAPPRPARVRHVAARYDGAWELPVIGEVPAPPAVLVRPDGHVVWAGALTDPALPRAMESWFGAGGVARAAA
jgi:2-polyprenyl-6-methoxyphenol hydroxylase-like FAD-dependent oxidoreductase